MRGIYPSSSQFDIDMVQDTDSIPITIQPSNDAPVWIPKPLWFFHIESNLVQHNFKWFSKPPMAMIMDINMPSKNQTFFFCGFCYIKPPSTANTLSVWQLIGWSSSIKLNDLQKHWPDSSQFKYLFVVRNSGRT